jgi:DNA-binding CsgD family transcriptional regulator
MVTDGRGDGDGDLAQLALEHLDVGVFLVDASSRRIVLANAGAREALAAFAPDQPDVPDLLWVRVAPAVEDAALVDGRFTPAMPVSAPDKRRFFVRCRLVRVPLLLMTIAPATLREIDLKRVLAEQFGLNSQEIRVAFYAAQGYRNKEIADRLNIVEGTVKNYLTQIFATLSVRSRTELATELSQLLEEQTDVHRRRG